MRLLTHLPFLLRCRNICFLTNEWKCYEWQILNRGNHSWIQNISYYIFNKYFYFCRIQMILCLCVLFPSSLFVSGYWPRWIHVWISYHISHRLKFSYFFLFFFIFLSLILQTHFCSKPASETKNTQAIKTFCSVLQKVFSPLSFS